MALCCACVPLPDLDSDTLIAINRTSIVARSVFGAAHDVNNALQIIGGSADIMAQRPDDTTATLRAVQRIRAQTERAADVLRVLMDFARAGQPVESRVSLRQIAAQALTLRAHAIRRAGLTTAFDADTAVEATVRGQRDQLLQAILNLVMNAEQALADRAGEPITVTVTAAPARVELTVMDRGAGIQADVVERLFTPFVVSSASERLGIGLAVTRLIARSQGGDVTIETGPAGTRAILSLPAAS